MSSPQMMRMLGFFGCAFAGSANATSASAASQVDHRKIRFIVVVLSLVPDNLWSGISLQWSFALCTPPWAACLFHRIAATLQTRGPRLLKVRLTTLLLLCGRLLLLPGGLLLRRALLALLGASF